MLDEPEDGPGGRPPLDGGPGGTLKSAPRKRILKLIRKRPGSRVTDIQIDTGMTVGVFFHHLKHLQQAGLVETRKSEGVTRAYPAGEAAPHPPGPFDNEAARDVARVVARKPGCTSEDIAVRLGLAQRTVQAHLLKLAEAGLVTRKRSWRTRTYEPTKALRDSFESEE